MHWIDFLEFPSVESTLNCWCSFKSLLATTMQTIFPHNSLFLFRSLFTLDIVRIWWDSLVWKMVRICFWLLFYTRCRLCTGGFYNDDLVCARNTINTLIIFQHLWHVHIRVNAHLQLFALSVLSYVIALNPYNLREHNNEHGIHTKWKHAWWTCLDAYDL